MKTYFAFKDQLKVLKHLHIDKKMKFVFLGLSCLKKSS